MYQIALYLYLMCFSVSLLADVRLKPKPGAVALTFDDGPDPAYTPTVLDILSRNNIKATFFICGGMAKLHPELVKRIKQEGHVIANHTYTHPNLAHLTQGRIEKEIKDTSDLIEQITGKRPKCLRPPFGSSNPLVREVAKQQEIRLINWDWNSFDYTGITPEAVVKNVLEHTKEGSVVLMHDAHRGGSRTALALQSIIDGYKKRDIDFDTLCD